MQHTTKLECMAQVRFSKRTSGEVVLTSFTSEHNHPMNKAIYLQDTPQINETCINIIETMISGKVKVSHIRNALKDNNIIMNSNQIRYQIKKILGRPMDAEKVEEMLCNIIEKGGFVNTKLYADGSIQALTISTNNMVNAFQGSKARVLQIDTTYRFGKKWLQIKLHFLL